MIIPKKTIYHPIRDLQIFREEEYKEIAKPRDKTQMIFMEALIKGERTKKGNNILVDAVSDMRKNHSS